MCGRFSLIEDINVLQEAFQFEFSGEITPRYNIAPGQQILTILSKDGKRYGENMKWGLVPYWSKDSKASFRMLNARSEGIEAKPSFKAAFKKRRVLIPSSGFYEWKKTEDKKQPYRFILENKKPFAFAGLWETWTKGEKPLVTCTIITTTPNEFY
ncbi:SOS response-associated peptidase [Neobacillus terrae]|uniref:SOS response-associated peptidase n=1 Tax=Neobacillus terrae TaxID=3034837 RepID=UPI00140C6773|nr:SOS response-associated peptidase [Neobacillus terrae]NHM33891.1 SOS response-associated peptidase [Neobacillus terrae]